MDKVLNFRMNLIAACDEELGIGKNNRLPWRLRKEMAYFESTTKRTNDAKKKNVVLMGRKNWESIPKNYRPLKDRINVVLSRTMTTKPCDGVYICKSLEDFYSLLSCSPLKDLVETVWNIGGSEIYKLGLQSPYFDHLYITRVKSTFYCDVHFPEPDWKSLLRISAPGVPEGDQEENGIKYEYEVYKKLKPELS